MLGKMRIGYGCDLHRFLSSGDHIMIGGVKIPHNQSIDAHSDGDVLLHAIVDAILGALNLGDIGQHFPPSSSQWKDCSSSVFVRHAVDLMHQNEFKISNLDTTIVCEKPKIGIHRESIIASIAELLSVEHEQVSVKAKTNEKVDAIGEQRAIAAHAIILLYRES